MVDSVADWLTPGAGSRPEPKGKTLDPLPASLYAQVWTLTRSAQIRICILTVIIAGLSMLPLEFQRRIVDDAVGDANIRLIMLLGGLYFLTILTSNGFKYLLNVTKGRVLEAFARDLRHRTLRVIEPRAASDEAGARASGKMVSVMASEAELVAGFASECFAVPMLQGGTILAIFCYLLWVEPLIAALAVVVYLPQVLILPRLQNVVNRLLRVRTRQMRRLGQDAICLEDEADAGNCRRDRAEGLVEKILAIRMRIYRWKYLSTFVGNVSDALGPIIVLVLGGYLVSIGKTEVSTLVVFISGFQKLAEPWDQLTNFYRSASNAHVSYRLVVETLGGSRADAAKPA